MLKFDPIYLLRAMEIPKVRELKERSYDLMCLVPGARALDIGCGPGLDIVPLAERVGPAGRVFGIDADPDLIALARQAANAANCEQQVELKAASCLALPLKDNDIDACRCERLLQHLTPEQGVATLKEACRVTKPGGRIVFLDTDWTSLSVQSPFPDLERHLAGLLVASLANGYAARGLLALFRDAGLANIEVETIVGSPLPSFLEYHFNGFAERQIKRGIFPAERWRTWLDDAHRRAEEKSYYATLNSVLCVGTRAT